MADALKKLWRMPLGLHVLALIVLLAIGFVVTKPLTVFTSDEGVVILQAQQLHESGQWLVDGPPSEIDPEQRLAVPYFGDLGTKGKAFYAKHPLYPLLLSWADRLTGVSSMVALSMIGTVLSSVGVALIARELGGLGDRVAFWLTGLGGPVAFYAYVVSSHTLATAAVAFMMLGVLRLLAHPSRRVVCLYTIGAIACGFLATLLRSEALFAGLAMAATLFMTGIRSRDIYKVRALVASGLLLTATVVAFVIDRIAKVAIVGDAINGVPSEDEGIPWFEARVRGFVHTWFGTEGMSDVFALVILVACCSIAVAAFAVRNKQQRTLIGAWIVVAACYLAITIDSPAAAIPGVMLALPVAWFGLLVTTANRSQPRFNVQFLIIWSVLSALAVIVTQYAAGGGVEWGGRYFQFILPAAIPLLVIAISNGLKEFDRARSAVVVLMVATSISTSVIGVAALRQNHRTVERLNADLASKLAQSQRSYVVSADLNLPQIAWPVVDSSRWIVADEAQLSDAFGRLAGLREARVVLLTSDPEKTLPVASAGYDIVRKDSAAGTTVSVVQLQLRASK